MIDSRYFNRAATIVRDLSALAVALCAILTAAPLAAQETPPASPPVNGQAADPAPETPDAPPSINAEQLKARVAELDTVTEPTEAQTQELAQLKSALTFLQQAQNARTDAAQFEEQARTAPDRLKQIESDLAQIKEQLAKPANGAAATIPPGATIDELTAQLEAARTQLEAAKKAQADVQTEFDKRNERRDRLPDEIAAANKRLDEVKLSLSGTGDPNDPPQLADAKRANLKTERQYLESLLTRLDQETRSYEARKNLIAARLEREKSRAQLADRPFNAIQKRVDAERAAIARRTREEAERQRREAASLHPAVKQIVEKNAELAKELETVSNRISKGNARSDELDAQFEQWSEAFKNIQAQVEQIGLSDVVGLRLRSQRTQLPSRIELQRRIRELEADMQRVQARRFELETPAWEDADAEALRLLEETAQPIPDELAGELIVTTAVEALRQQREYVDRLERQYELYFNIRGEPDTLSVVHRSELALLELIDEYIGYIDERVLWIKSANPIGSADFEQALDAVEWLVDPAGWGRVLSALWEDARAKPLSWLWQIALLGGLAGSRYRARTLLPQIARQVGRATTDRYSLTLQAAALTAASAAVWPALLWIIASRLANQAVGDPFIGAISTGLNRAAALLIIADSIKQLCRSDGLAEVHFRWDPNSLKLVRRHLRWLVPLGIPLAFLVSITDFDDPQSYHNSLGRFGFLMAMFALAVFAQRLLGPSNGILKGYLSRHRGSWMDRLRYIWLTAIISLPLILAMEAWLGYFFTSIQLERHLIMTVVLIVLTLVVHAMLLRWLLVAQRRLALGQARQRLAAQAKARAEERVAASGDAENVPPPSADTAPPLEEIQFDLAAINVQSRRMLRGFAWLGLAIGLLLAWSDILPAFGILDNVVLWNTSSPSAEAVTTQAGETATTVATQTNPVTLADLGKSLVIVIFTVVMSRNIGGLLEIAVLQRLPFTPGGRYAITTLARYTIVVVGIVAAFNTVGIGWSKVQFLAAAVTVGLGFGLQEIFANFVSGIIILFERPVQVGDTVTVGTTSGTVSRIRMRATTITDWDRKELIIPNKEFVTGQIINWSLSDHMLRIIVPVGVAYGSDTAKARKILLELAKQHAQVLDDPVPRALFLGFGDSSLNIELRVFIGHIDYLLAVKDDLHTAIDNAFREAGIEIAFPQRDVHVRSIRDVLPIHRSDAERIDAVDVKPKED